MQTTWCKMTNSKPQDVPRTLKFTIEITIVYVDKPSSVGGEADGGGGNKQTVPASFFLFL